MNDIQYYLRNLYCSRIFFNSEKSLSLAELKVSTASLMPTSFAVFALKVTTCIPSPAFFTSYKAFADKPFLRESKNLI